MSQTLLRVAPGRRVPLPDGRILTEEAGAVLLDAADRFVQRRIADGDLLPAEEE